MLLFGSIQKLKKCGDGLEEGCEVGRKEGFVRRRNVWTQQHRNATEVEKGEVRRSES
jgi:hypothetical protein